MPEYYVSVVFRVREESALLAEAKISDWLDSRDTPYPPYVLYGGATDDPQAIDTRAEGEAAWRESHKEPSDA